MAKKIISIFMACILILGIAPVSLAKNSSEVVYDPDTDTYEQYGFVFEEYEDEMFGTERYCYIREYKGTDDTIYIPKELDGIEINIRSFDAELFLDTKATAFSADADNKYYSVKDGVLFDKDGTRLIAYPNGRKDTHYDIPEGVTNVYFLCFKNSSLKSVTIPSTMERICDDAFGDSLDGFFTKESGLIYYNDMLISYDEDYFYSDDFCGYCTVKDGTTKILAETIPYEAAYAVIPDSVKTILEVYTVLCGNKGSYAEKYAYENGVDFIALGEGHEHIFLPVVSVRATCKHDGRTDFICPCGKTAGSVELTNGGHYYMFDDKGELVCFYCGTVIEDYDYCTCKCHSLKKATFPSYDNFFDFISELFFRLKLVFWHLTGTHQYCECGKRHY